MSDQQQENEITTTQAAPAAPVASDQVAAPAQASAPETPTPATAEKAVPATGEEAVPAKPKRTRRAAKPVADGEEVTKPDGTVKFSPGRIVMKATAVNQRGEVVVEGEACSMAAREKVDCSRF